MHTSHYEKSGVAISKSNQFEDWIGSLVKKKTKQFLHGRMINEIGDYAGIYEAKFMAGQVNNHYLAVTTDGVGTKSKLAAHYGDLSGLGQDLVAMNVNDLICVGARPILFLDYFATSVLKLRPAKQFLKSVKVACNQAQCFLAGGETAEMPGMYQKSEFDCAGFAMGLLKPAERIGGFQVKRGHYLISISSSGFHSNGYSLIRECYREEIFKKKMKDVLLKPTALYVDVFFRLRELIPVYAAAHITGNGFRNIERILPKGLRVKFDKIEFSDLFLELQRKTQMSTKEMLETFNCGHGMVLAVDEISLHKAKATIESHGFKFSCIGVISG
jgi:phosphoribosylformylglycinamidine cyclo-ligase